MVLEDGWDSARRGGAGRYADVDVESSLLGGLAEMQERQEESKRSGGTAGVVRRRRIIMASGLMLVVVLVVGSVVGEAGSSKRRDAEAVCRDLASQETAHNRAGEWVGWAGAVKEVYLSHRSPANQVPVNLEGEALRCAKSGWKTSCTEKLFGRGAVEQDELERISDERRSLEKEYNEAVKNVPEPEANKLRLPAGIALKIKRGIASGQSS